MRKKVPELLAPAGDMESLHAAIEAGCDAVYFGVSHLNMRAKKQADSFQISDLRKVKRVCEKAGVACYGALNTVLYDQDLSLSRRLIATAKRAGIQGMIVADGAALHYCKEQKLPAHISTQVSVSNIEAVRFYSRFADRMVLARELTLPQIKKIIQTIKKEDITGPGSQLVEIELFAHGARCIAISGRCWMSLHAYNASANRGLCRQLCRRAYTVVDQVSGEAMEIDNHYVMSPKDLCTLNFLDQLVASGVHSLKIEGRSRSSEYVYTITRAYRQALDALAQGSYTQGLVRRLMKDLKTVYHRGYSPGYYLGKKQDAWSGKYGSHATHRKVYCGKVINYYARHQVAHIRIEAAPLRLHEEVLLTGPTTGVLKFKVAELRRDEESLTSARQGDEVTMSVPKKVRKNDRLHVFQLKKQP